MMPCLGAPEDLTTAQGLTGFKKDQKTQTNVSHIQVTCP